MHSNQPEKKNCCDQREVKIVGGDDDFQPEPYFVIAPSVEVIPIAVTPVVVLHAVDIITKHFRNHSPPILGPPLYILVRSLLI